MKHLFVSLLAFSFTGLILNCTGSTESDPPTEIRVENNFEKIVLDGGDTVIQVNLYGVTVGDESFGNLTDIVPNMLIIILPLALDVLRES